VHIATAWYILVTELLFVVGIQYPRQSQKKRLDALQEEELETWIKFVNNGNPDLRAAAAKLREQNVDGDQFFNECELQDLTAEYKLTGVETVRILNIRREGRKLVIVSWAFPSSQVKGKNH